MKRAKKSFWFLAGLLLLLGFCFRDDVLASSLTSLPGTICSAKTERAIRNAVPHGGRRPM